MLEFLKLGRIMRFGVVGVTATLTYAGIAFILSYGSMSVTLPAAVASFFAYVVAMPVSYLGHKHFTFGSSGTHALEAPRFLASALLGIGLSCLLPLIIVDGIGLTPAVSIILVCILVPATNYVVLERWVFASEGHGSQ